MLAILILSCKVLVELPSTSSFQTWVPFDRVRQVTNLEGEKTSLSPINQVVEADP